MEKCSPCLFLFISTLVLALTTVIIPFSPTIGILAGIAGISEFALGLLDTGIFVYCLQIWKEKAGQSTFFFMVYKSHP